MKYKKIHIVGIYGSGKSTLAKRISEILGYPVYDLDEIKYERKYDKIRSVEERKRIVRSISNEKTWITEGAWLDNALPLFMKADLVVFLEIPKWILYKRVLSRHFKRRKDEKKYVGHNMGSTFRMLKRIKKYFHDPEHFMTLQAHKDQIAKYAKKSVAIKTKKDLENLYEMLEK